MLKELALRNRSYRRFYQDHTVSQSTLEYLVDLTRYGASAANKQPLRYIISCDPLTNGHVYAHLAWAAYLSDWSGPEEGERPAAYLVILNDLDFSTPWTSIDVGIACQTILLGAAELGLGGCIFASVKRDKLSEVLKIPSDYEILLVVALGKPKETVVIEPVEKGEIKYWRDTNGVHHVPKRALSEIIIK